jgi:hypothetical protein
MKTATGFHIEENGMVMRAVKTNYKWVQTEVETLPDFFCASWQGEGRENSAGPFQGIQGYGAERRDIQVRVIVEFFRIWILTIASIGETDDRG